MNKRNFFPSIFGLMILFAGGLVVTGVLSSANVTKLRPNIFEFAADTLEEDEEATFAIENQNKSRTGIGFQITATELTGTLDALGIIQESFWGTPTEWYNADTVVIDGDGNFKWEGTYRAPWIQLLIQTDTTNQNAVFNVAAAAVQDF